MKHTILDTIISEREKNIDEKGFAFGYEIPTTRDVPLVPFLPKKGVILEIKKASPSKGWIAKDLNIEEKVNFYVHSGASAISVLTEENYFHGSIKDLMTVKKSLKDKEIAVLRKDFLIDKEEIDISYKIGADAVLLIASVLGFEKSKIMIQKTLDYGMSVLYEVRTKEEFEIYYALAKYFEKEIFFNKVILGINARDLKSFKIDSLIPLFFLQKLGSNKKAQVKIVYESGIKTSEMAEQLSFLGFDGLLIGEGVVKNKSAKKIVKSFNNTNLRKSFWLDYVSLFDEKKVIKKICGFTKLEDVLFAINEGAKMLGFIFSNKSKRNANVNFVKNVHYKTENLIIKLLRVAVVTDLHSKESRNAQRLVKKGYLDVLQLHDFAEFHGSEQTLKKVLRKIRRKNLPYYCALSVTSEKDIEAYHLLQSFGEFRVLLDMPKTNEGLISKELLENTSGPLWIAGGLSPENIKEFMDLFSIELLDFARATETGIGEKDFEKVKQVLEIV